MIDITQLFSSFLEGTVKVLPALLAAYYAYRLWYFKLAQDRADSIAKGCVILHHFCISLERHIVDDPQKSNAVTIESINSNLDSILGTRTISVKFGEILETYHLWRKGVYFPLSQDNEADVEKRRASLRQCAQESERVVEVIRNSTPKQLAKRKLSSL